MICRSRQPAPAPANVTPVLLAAKDFSERFAQFVERTLAVTFKAGTVHDCEFRGLQGGQLLKYLVGVVSVGGVIGEKARLVLLHRLARSAYHVGPRQRLDFAHLMEQVRT